MYVRHCTPPPAISLAHHQFCDDPIRSHKVLGDMFCPLTVRRYPALKELTEGSLLPHELLLNVISQSHTHTRKHWPTVALHPHFFTHTLAYERQHAGTHSPQVTEMTSL